MSRSYELARVEPAASRTPVATEAMTFDQIVAMGDTLVGTGFLPEYIQSGAQAAAIILTGREYGLDAMRSLRSFVMVKGRVVENADSLLARFKEAGGRAEFTTYERDHVRLALQHPNGDTHVEDWTVEDARTAGLFDNRRMYEKYPRAMLRSRAITAGLKSLGWSGAAGVYSAEEAREFDAQEIDAGAGTPARPDAPLPAAPRDEPRLPGDGKAFGGWGGKPVADVPDTVLSRFVEWVDEKPDRQARHGMLAGHIIAVLDDRQAPSAADEESAEAGAAQESA